MSTIKIDKIEPLTGTSVVIDEMEYDTLELGTISPIGETIEITGTVNAASLVFSTFSIPTTAPVTPANGDVWIEELI